MPVTEISLKAIGMLRGFNSNVWAPAITLGGKAQINRDGWEITEMWDDMFQAVAISSKYRFCGQGITPKAAFKEARKQMETMRDELNIHLVTK